MTREETKKIIRIIVDSYPNYKPDNLSETTDVWQMILEEYPYQKIALALKSYILSDESGFAPSIGQIISRAELAAHPQELNEMEAWALVRKAISNSGYNATLEFSRLPPLVQKAVGLPEQLAAWAMTENLNEAVISSNFIKCYRSLVEKENSVNKMPQEMRKAIDDVNAGSACGAIEDMRKNVNGFAGIPMNVLGESRECVPMPDKCKEDLDKLLN